MDSNSLQSIAEARQNDLLYSSYAGFHKAQSKVLNFINSHRRPLDKGGTYYRLSVEDIIDYIEKMEYKS